MLMTYCLPGVSQRITDMIQCTVANMKFTGIQGSGSPVLPAGIT
jgi:hypothetical protein